MNEEAREETVALEDILSSEKCDLFATALNDCCIRIKKDDEISEPHIFLDEYILTCVSEDVSTPFSNVVGKSTRKTVIVSKVDKGNEHDSESSTEETIKLPFSIYRCPSISVANSTKLKAVLLNKEELFPHRLLTSLFLSDTGALPLTHNEVHLMCSVYVMCFRSNVWARENFPNMWVLSEGKTVCMGCCPEESNNQLHIYKVVTGSSLAVPDSSSYSITLDWDPFNTRMGIERGQQMKKCHKMVTAEYRFGPVLNETIQTDISAQAQMKHVAITLDFMWSGKDACFSPPPVNSDVVVGVSVTPGYLMSPVLAVYSELVTLLQLCKIFEHDDLESWTSWPGSQSFNDCGDDESVIESEKVEQLSLVHKVDHFLEDSTTYTLKLMESSHVISPTAVLSPFQPCEDLDFLDQLWIYLQHVASSQDLVDTLGAVCKAVLLRKIQPFVHQSKSSTLGLLICQCLSSHTMDQKEVTAAKLQSLLTERDSLKCLIEIGLEKMQKDYVTFFTSNGLAAMSNLDPFFYTTDLLQRCHNLCKLQYVLELAGVLSTFLSLPLSSLSLFVRDTLKYYLTVDFKDFSTSPIFSIQFPAMSACSKSLVSLASSLKPVKWTVTIFDVSNKKKRMFYVAEPIFKYTQTSTSEIHENILYSYYVENQSVTF